ncbi:MAG: collagen binding domain-containing protein [Candidatus Pristimantibacillus sp.]
MKKKKSIALILAFLLIFQYMNYAGVLKTAEAAGTISENILTKMTLTDKDIPSTVIASVYNGASTVYPDIRVELGRTLSLNYEWELPEGHNYKNGDTFVFDLPEELEMYGGNIAPKDLVGQTPSVGTYEVTNNRVTVTFNNQIEGKAVSGSLSFWNFFSKESVDHKTEVKLDFKIGDELTILIAPSVSKPISKEGAPDKSFNANEITWKIDVNKDLKNVKNAVLSDLIPTGLDFVPGSLKVSKMDTDTEGNLTNPQDVSYQSISLPDGSTNELEIGLGDITSSYRIEYKTKITDITIAEFKNTAKFIGTNTTEVSADKTVKNERGKFLEKSGDYHADTQIIDWTVKYNFGADTLNNAVVTDLFDDEHKLISGSIEVFLVPDPVAGTQGTKLTLGTDYTTNVNISSHPNASNKNGFNLLFTNPINSAYIIKYKTEPVGNVYDNFNLSNTAYSESKSSNTVTISINQNFLKKNYSNANYAARTVDWTVELNAAKYDLKELNYEDTFGAGLKLVPGTMVIKKNGTVTNSVYVLDYMDGKTDTTQGFNIEFNDAGQNAYTITYTTQYDYDTTTYYPHPVVNDIIKDFGFNNKGDFSWKEVSGSVVIEKDVTSGTFTPNPQTQNNGFKNGSYDATAKKLTWEIGINYNSKVIPGAKVSDTLTSSQELIVNSLKVYEMTVNSGGSINKGDPVDSMKYQVVLPTDANSNELTITFNDPTITQPYLITFETELEGVLIDNTNITNNAVFSSTTLDPQNLSKTIQVQSAGEYVNKAGKQNGESIDWMVWINRGQSTVDEAKINDVPSKKQTLIKQSFHLYDTTVEPNGVVKKSTLVDPSQYDLIFTDNTDPLIASDETFTLAFKNKISRPYLLEYKSIIDAKDGDKITNMVSFTGSGGINKSLNQPTSITVALSGAEGNGSTYIGSLKVIKVDSANTDEKLEGAKFELTRISSGKKVTGTTAANGEYVFSNLGYGKYTLKEIAAPSGYLLDASKTDEVLINSNTVIDYLVENTKKLAPSPSTSPSPSPSPSATPDPGPGTVPTPDPSTSPSPTTSPTPSATPSATPNPGPGTVPTPEPSTSPSPTPSTVPTVEPSATPSVAPSPSTAPTTEPSATPVSNETPAPSETPIVEKEKTKENTPVKGIVEVPKGSVPSVGDKPTSGKVVISPNGEWVYTPKKGFVGKDKFSVIVKDINGNEEEILVEVIVEELPLGGIETSPDVNVLPKTGEESTLPLQLFGLALIAGGGMLLARKRKAGQRK